MVDHLRCIRWSYAGWSKTCCRGLWCGSSTYPLLSLFTRRKLCRELGHDIQFHVQLLFDPVCVCPEHPPAGCDLKWRGTGDGSSGCTHGVALALIRGLGCLNVRYIGARQESIYQCLGIAIPEGVDTCCKYL